MAKVLIVIDGLFNFSPGGIPAGITNFTYVELVNALVGAKHVVTKAHRQQDSSADYEGFDFASTIDLLRFDVIWLLGYNSVGRLPDSELAKIAQFMEAGGGVFATGDHDSIGAEMCGNIVRVRAMRCWFGANDSGSTMKAYLPRNFPAFGTNVGGTRADTCQKNVKGKYPNFDLDGDGNSDPYVYSENQSDSVPQPLTAVPPIHPILKREDGTQITVYPDHMHEGQTLGEVNGYPYAHAEVIFGGETFKEFRIVGRDRQLPEVIATGQSAALASLSGNNQRPIDPPQPSAKTVNLLSVYDGRKAGVGRIVTGSTWHHYVDINLTGTSALDPTGLLNVGSDAEKGKGFNDNPAVFADIKQVFVNITNWLARPQPKIQMILETSTFSQDQAVAFSRSGFAGAILVTVDGLKPNQFPGGGITTLFPPETKLLELAPELSIVDAPGIEIVPMGVASENGLLDKLQRITFIYRVKIDPQVAFGFADDFKHFRINAVLKSATVAHPLTDTAWISLVKSADPHMLDLDGDNETPWLSSDVCVFPVIAGVPVAGVPGSPLRDNASRQDALEYLEKLLSIMEVKDFLPLANKQRNSVLSTVEKTSGSPERNVYNFAIARVRLSRDGAAASDVRVFFRVFRSQTTAALTFNRLSDGTPLNGYRQTSGAEPISLPGTDNGGSEIISFPMFASALASDPAAQKDSVNVKTIASGSSAFFGCLIDTNLPGRPVTAPGAPALADLRLSLMGAHQCIVAQIEYPGTPIPNGANPFTSDKLAQRNMAMSVIANPGLDASRRAFHTFEIEASPHGGSEGPLPDELLLEWHGCVPDGTEVRLFIPSWNAEDVAALADRLYPRHEIRVIDAQTIAVPGNGMRYIPLPASQHRQTGVISAEFPLGITKGQRFDLSVRQISNRGRQAEIEPPKVRRISMDEAEAILAELDEKREAGERDDDKGERRRGVFEIARNTILVTDLSVLDEGGDHAVIIENPDPEETAALQARDGGQWRETIGAFQLGIPVSVKTEMLEDQMRLLSMMRWRAEHLQPTSRWYLTFMRYVELNADKVRGLGGNPDTIPATPDGTIDIPGKDRSKAKICWLCRCWLWLCRKMRR